MAVARILFVLAMLVILQLSCSHIIGGFGGYGGGIGVIGFGRRYGYGYGGYGYGGYGYRPWGYYPPPPPPLPFYG